jgi:soluble cytochrome b562
MKSLLRLTVTLALLIAGPAAFGAKKEKEETELTKKMDGMKDAFRLVRQQVADASKNADSLKLVAIIKEHAAAAAKMEPFKLTEIPAADRPKMLAGYREEMKELAGELDKLEAALKAGHNDQAAKLVDDIIAVQKEGHKEYKSKSID